MIIICTYDAQLLPIKKTEGSVCFDLHIKDDIMIKPQTLCIVGTGVKIAFPPGRHGKIYPRSSLPKRGLMLANSVGILDADYRGECLLQLYNFTTETVKCDKYDRLTQLEILPYFLYEKKQIEVTNMPDIKMIVDKDLYENFEKNFPTERGEGGFGSTGV